MLLQAARKGDIEEVSYDVHWFDLAVANELQSNVLFAKRSNHKRGK